MKRNKAIIVGSGGHGKVVYEIVKNKYDIIGYSDIEDKKNQLKYLGTDDNVIQILEKNPNIKLFLGLSYIGKKVSLDLRNNILDFFENHGFYFSKIISNNTIISETVLIEEGVFIGNNVVINPNAVIGKNALINTGAIIEHDVKISKNTQIGPGALLLGGVQIGANCFIGAGSIIRDSVLICNNVIIGMGSIVTANINNSGTYYGNPLKHYK